jgi:hypothetical protein
MGLGVGISGDFEEEKGLACMVDGDKYNRVN